MMHGKKIWDYMETLKLHLCLYISLSVVFGHAMAGLYFSFRAFLPAMAVLCLACGCAVLNNIQDRYYDAFFLRTLNRSLPKKRIPLFHAKLMALVLIVMGLSGLSLLRSLSPFFWGIISVVCYNLLYTPLKKYTMLAFIPGTMCGMIPPLIGWTAAGKTLSDPGIIIIMGVFGLWQIPHFFIFLLKTHTYQSRTGSQNKIPMAADFFSQNDIKLQILIWTSLYSLAILLFLINGAIENHFLSVLCGLNAFGVICLVSLLMLKRKNQGSLFAFSAINLSILLFMGTGIYDRLLV